MKMNFSLDAAILITLISALLFMVGQVYLGSYLKIFGVDLATLNLSIQDKLYIGYLRTFEHAIYFLLFLVIVFFIPYLFNTFKRNIWFTNFLNTIKEKLNSNSHQPPIHNSLQLSSTEKVHNQRLFSIYSVLIILIGCHFYLFHTQENSKKIAHANLKSYSTALTKISLRNSPKEAAYKIYCGQTLCAVLTVSSQQRYVKYIDPKEITIPISML